MGIEIIKKDALRSDLSSIDNDKGADLVNFKDKVIDGGNEFVVELTQGSLGESPKFTLTAVTNVTTEELFVVAKKIANGTISTIFSIDQVGNFSTGNFLAGTNASAKIESGVSGILLLRGGGFNSAQNGSFNPYIEIEHGNVNGNGSTHRIGIGGKRNDGTNRIGNKVVNGVVQGALALCSFALRPIQFMINTHSRVTINHKGTLFSNDSSDHENNTPQHVIDVRDTRGVRLSMGTTAQRPDDTLTDDVSPVSDGLLRYNTDTRSYEFFDGSTGLWATMAKQDTTRSHGTAKAQADSVVTLDGKTGSIAGARLSSFNKRIVFRAGIGEFNAQLQLEVHWDIQASVYRYMGHTERRSSTNDQLSILEGFFTQAQLEATHLIATINNFSTHTPNAVCEFSVFSDTFNSEGGGSFGLRVEQTTDTTQLIEKDIGILAETWG